MPQPLPKRNGKEREIQPGIVVHRRPPFTGALSSRAKESVPGGNFLECPSFRYQFFSRTTGQRKPIGIEDFTSESRCKFATFHDGSWAPNKRCRRLIMIGKMYHLLSAGQFALAILSCSFITAGSLNKRPKKAILWQSA